MDQLKLWKCNKCNNITERLQIHWGICGGQKVDVLDYFCPNCTSGKLSFLGTSEELNKYWDKEWDGGFDGTN
jgi:hypothetical protein